MAKKDKETNVLIIIGIILALVFFTRTDFYASIVTTCENVEPTNISYYQFNLTAAEAGAGFSSGNPMSLMIGNATLDFNTYTSTSSIGVFALMDTNSHDCVREILPAVDNMSVNSTLKSVVGKTVLDDIDNTLFYWCNNENSLLIWGTPSDYLNYMSTFEICITEEIPDVNETNVTDTVSGAAAGTGITPAPVVAPTAEEEDFASKNRMVIVAVVAIVVFAAWWFFEKGPDKGLVRKRRKRR
jgi:hypothetical protein